MPRSRRVSPTSEEEDDDVVEELMDEEEEEEEEEVKPRRQSGSKRSRSSNSRRTSSSQRSSSNRRTSSSQQSSDGEDENNADDDDENDDGEMMFSSQAPEMTQEIMQVKATEHNNLMALDEDAREKVLQDLLRLVLFKGLAGEPIDRVKVAKEAGISDARISSAAFDEVNTRLKDIFDYKLVRVPAWMEQMKDLPKKFKDRYYVVNGAAFDDDQTAGAHHKAIHSNTVQGSVERGLLMVILAFVFCKGDPRSDGSRWLLDKDLYELLHKVDENIHSEPPLPGQKRGKRRNQQALEGTPDVDALLHKFVHMDYLLEVKAGANEQLMSMNDNAEPESIFYALGPRSAMEIGRLQIVYFCAELLDGDVDQTMLDELKDEEDE
mmetsp:Transcript_12431/g.34500  ORF Transcript_12431/g.34500 Transcript_12431/m.34500 type:complete len:379 (-) Transcript_12431:50-1186(-)